MDKVMTIRMCKLANRLMAEHVAVIFAKQDVEVFVKNGNSAFTLVALGDRAKQICSSLVGGAAGIDRIFETEEHFGDRRHEFVPAREFFRD